VTRAGPANGAGGEAGWARAIGVTPALAVIALGLAATVPGLLEDEPC
jgi:hypothetical protein